MKTVPDVGETPKPPYGPNRTLQGVQGARGRILDLPPAHLDLVARQLLAQDKRTWPVWMLKAYLQVNGKDTEDA